MERPRFFIPAVEPARQEDFYRGLRRSILQAVFCRLSSMRIYALEYWHTEARRILEARVGLPPAGEEEPLMAVFYDESHRGFLLCTESRGGMRGTPYFLDSVLVRRTHPFLDSEVQHL